MKLIRQVVNDLRRELIWLAVYSVLASMVLSALPGILGGLTSASVKEMQETEEYMRMADISMILVKGLKLSSVPDSARAGSGDRPGPYTGRSLKEIFREGFSRGGSLGCWAAERDPYSSETKYVYFVGRYVDLAPVDVPEDCDYYICVTEENAGLVGKTVSVEGAELLVSGVIPNDAMIYHPVHPELSANHSGALFVFIRDYESLRRVFWYGPTIFVNNCLLSFGADEEELAELVAAIERETGKFAFVQTMEEYLGAQTNRMRNYTGMIFSIGAAAALIAAMAMNVSRAIRRWEPEYSIHRLFGAPRPFIFARMALFGLGYNLPAILYLWYTALFPAAYSVTYYADGTEVTEKARGTISLAGVGRTALATGLITVFVLAISLYEFCRSNAGSAEGRRGE